MRTQIMNDPNAGKPWLEYYQVGGSRPTRQDIRQFPFVIGRDESADFQVESSRVSRKHVVIEQNVDGYVLRDLGSTNGTYVNGKRVDEAPLGDGDVVVIADFELTFFRGTSASRVSATQVMTQPVDGCVSDTADLILQVRRLHETLTHRSITSHFQPIVDLQSGDMFGLQALRDMDEYPSQNRQAESIVQGTECRLTERISQQHRLVAAEQARQLDERTHLFFGLQVSEVSADFLPESLSRLDTIIARKHQLVAEVPETAVCDIPYFREFVEGLRERSIEVAYGGFSSGPTQIADWSNIAPHYLKLAPALVRGISRASDAWRQVQSIVNAMRDLDRSVVAVGVDDDADADCLRELGCQFGQGKKFGKPAEITSFIKGSGALAGAHS